MGRIVVLVTVLALVLPLDAQAHTLRFPNWAAGVTEAAFRSTGMYTSVRCRLIDGRRHVRCAVAYRRWRGTILEHRVAKNRIRADIIVRGRVVRRLFMPFKF
jgi:hypothetical protein